jgi:multidrug resistance efflux pump
MLVNKMLNSTLKTIKNSIPSIPSLTEEQIESYTKTFETSIIDNKKDISSLVNASQLIEEQLTNLNTKTATQKNIIISLKTKLELANKQLEQAKINYNNALKKSENNLLLAQKQIDISEASLNTKTDDVSYSELAPYYSSIDSAKKALEEAVIKLEDAILKSPID